MGSSRKFFVTYPPRDILRKKTANYDAFKNDIAIVQLYFEKATALQIYRQATMNWLDYLANVGGLLGLVLGMGFVSVFEIIWLCCRIATKQLHLTALIP
jgi:hypothetical protein